MKIRFRKKRFPKTIVYVAHYDPSCDYNGAKMRFLAMARICRRLGYEVVFARSDNETIYTLNAEGSFVDRGAFVKDKFFRAHDVLCVIFSWFWIARHSQFNLTRLHLDEPHVPVVLDTIDAVGIRQSREYVATDSQTPTSSFTLNEEILETRRADWILAITEEEKHYFQTMTEAPVMVLSYGEDDTASDTTGPEDNTPLPLKQSYVTGFFGSQNYANYHSAIRCCHIAWMSGRIERFILAGSVCKYSDLCVRLQARYGDWLEIIGFVDTPADFYDAVDFTTNILAFGSGVKIKVIESLTYGRPAIGNEVAFEGLTHLETYDLGMCRAETAFEYSAALDRGLVGAGTRRKDVCRLAKIQNDLFVQQIKGFVAKLGFSQ